jgi:hypothetical protein
MLVFAGVSQAAYVAVPNPLADQPGQGLSWFGTTGSVTTGLADATPGEVAEWQTRTVQVRVPGRA